MITVENVRRFSVEELRDAHKNVRTMSEQDIIRKELIERFWNETVIRRKK